VKIVFLSCCTQQIPETRTIHCLDMQNTGFMRMDFLASVRPLRYASNLTGLTPFDFSYRCGGKTSSNKVYTVTSPWNITHSLVLKLGLSCVFAPCLKFINTHIHGNYSISFVSFEVVSWVLLFIANSVTLSVSYIVS